MWNDRKSMDEVKFVKTMLRINKFLISKKGMYLGH